MSCPKCQGLVLPDRAEYDEWYCLNCGLRLIQGRPVSVPPLRLLQPIQSSGRVRAYKERTREQKFAHNEYMRAYMKQYRRRHKRTEGG